MIPVSSVEIQTQILGVAIAIVGTNLSLHYSSDRVLGRQAEYTLDIPLTGKIVPEDLKRIWVDIELLGQEFHQSFTPESQQRYQFTWNRCDAEGNLRSGKHPVTTRISHIFKAPKLPSVQETTTTLGVFEAKTLGLGGWTFNVHHYYDRIGKVLYFGNGQRRTNVTALSSAIQCSIDPPKSPFPRGTLANAPLGKGGWGDLNVPNNGFAIPSENGGLLYLFDKQGMHLQTVNTLTRQVVYHFEYTESGLLAGITNTHGTQVSIKRDEQENPVEIISEYGDSTVLCLNADGYLNAIANPAGAVSQFYYTPLGLLTQFSDPNGNAYQFEYDDLGLLRSYNEPDGSFFILDRTLTDQGVKVSKITTTGRESTYLTEALIGGGERQINQGCGGTGAIVAVTDKDGNETITYPDGSTLIQEQQPDPRFGKQAPMVKRTVLKTPGGLEANLEVTRSCTLTDPKDPLSLATLTDTVNFNGRTSTTTFDAQNQQVIYKSPAGRQSILNLDDRGRVVKTEVAGLEPVTFAYDEKGRLLSAMQGNQTILSYSYDEQGRLSSLANAEGNQVHYTYDEVGRIVQTTLPSGRTYKFAYDANSNLTEIVVPSGAVHTLQYNAVNMEAGYMPPAIPPNPPLTSSKEIPPNPPLKRGGFEENSSNSSLHNEENLSGSNSPLFKGGGGGSYSSTYDSEQQLTNSTLPSGRTVQGIYNQSGYLESAIYPEAQVDVTYEKETRRVTKLVRTPAEGGTPQEMTFTYDGGLVTEMAWSGVTNGTYRYRYDNNFSLVGMQLDDQPEIDMKRDADGLLTQYGQFQILRNQATGAPTQMTDGRMNVDIEYDKSGRVISRTNRVNGRVIYQLQLSYDLLSRIVQKRETVAGATQTYDYTYDADGQLILVKRDGEVVERYVYDENGNRTEWQLGTEQHSASYDAQDRLIELDGTPYEFDADGFLIQRGDMTLKYSATGELLEVSWPDGKAIQYTYDSMNRRVARTDEKGTEQYLYGNPNHPFQVTAVRDNSGKLSVYEYDDFGSLFALKRDGNLYYVTTDQLGTPRVVCDVDGQAIKVLDYNSFGQEMGDSNSGFGLPVRFAGGLLEADTELVRFGFRDYDSVAGKWTVRDPIGFDSGDTNLSRYVANDPVNLIDPTGLNEEFKMFIDFWNGTGPTTRVFGPNTPQAQNMQNALKVNKARDMFYKKNAKCLQNGESLQALTDFAGGFGPIEFIFSATLQGDITEHFIGSFDHLNITPNNDGTIRFTLRNSTTNDSLWRYTGIPGIWNAFGQTFNYERKPGVITPGGNTYQTIWWDEPIRQPKPTLGEQFTEIKTDAQNWLNEQKMKGLGLYPNP